jgi:hypothetical protein
LKLYLCIIGNDIFINSPLLGKNLSPNHFSTSCSSSKSPKICYKDGLELITVDNLLISCGKEKKYVKKDGNGSICSEDSPCSSFKTVINLPSENNFYDIILLGKFINLFFLNFNLEKFRIVTLKFKRKKFLL